MNGSGLRSGQVADAAGVNIQTQPTRRAHPACARRVGWLAQADQLPTIST